MAGFPGGRFSRWNTRPIYPLSAKAAASELETIEVNIMNASNTDFRKALDGVITARNREATRQIVRSNEFQLIGAFTKRPN